MSAPYRAEGTTSVTPNNSVTYTITATGPGGSANASARVTVNAPPPPPAPVAAAPSPTMEELFTREVMDAFFDFDKANVRADAQAALMKTARIPAVLSAGQSDHRGPLRRARLNRIQPGSGRPPRASGQGFPGLAWAWPRIACRPSATARNGRSAPTTTRTAGSRTAAPTSPWPNSRCWPSHPGEIAAELSTAPPASNSCRSCASNDFGAQGYGSGRAFSAY